MDRDDGHWNRVGSQIVKISFVRLEGVLSWEYCRLFGSETGVVLL